MGRFGLEMALSFAECVATIGRDRTNAIDDARRGPGDDDLFHEGRGADSDVLLERVAAEARSVSYCAEDMSHLAGIKDRHVNDGAEGGAVGANPGEAQRNPVVGIAGIPIESGLIGVPGLRSAYLLKDVLKAGAVKVGKCDAVTLCRWPTSPAVVTSANRLPPKVPSCMLR